MSDMNKKIGKWEVANFKLPKVSLVSNVCTIGGRHFIFEYAHNKTDINPLLIGFKYEEPIIEINLVNDTLSAPPVTPAEGDTYIVGATATGIWEGLEGHALVWHNSAWVDLKGRAVVPGDRFGVKLTTSTAVGVSLTAHISKLVTVTDATVGAILYTADVTGEDSVTLVSNNTSPNFCILYKLTAEGTWVPTNTRMLPEKCIYELIVDDSNKTINFLLVGRMPESLLNVRAFELNGHVYLFGIIADENKQDDHYLVVYISTSEEFLKGSPKWDCVDDYFHSDTVGTICLVNDYLYTIGGFDYNVYGDSVPTAIVIGVNDEDAIASKIPCPLVNTTVLATKKMMYTIGGDNGYEESDYIFGSRILKPGHISSDWKTKGRLPYSVSNANIITVGDKVYLLGGVTHKAYEDTPFTDMVSSTTITNDLLGDIWTEEEPLPVGMSCFTTFQTESNIYLLGGYSKTELRDEVLVAPLL